MSRSNNIRRAFKLILKDYSRGKFKDYFEVGKYMEQFGFYDCQLWEIELFLKTKIKSRVVNRIRKAALKRGKLVSLLDFVSVWRKKNKAENSGDTIYSWLVDVPNDYHLIPFIKVSYKEREYIEVIKIIEKDGQLPVEIYTGLKEKK